MSRLSTRHFLGSVHNSRQPDRKRRAAAGLACDLDGAAHRLGQFLDDRQAEARAHRPLAAETRVEVEPLEGVGVVVLVETDVADPERAPSLVAAGTAHLSVVVREADIVVGPLVVPGDGPCLRCLDLHRTDADPAWPTLAGQLRDSAPADESAVTAVVASPTGLSG